MDNIFYEISLAGLLHDIGKIGQRAFEAGKGLSEQSLRMEDHLCSKNLKGQYYTRQHVLYTNEFCQSLAEYYPPSLNPNRITNLASFHHNPEDDLQKIIQEADVLSSAMERIPEEEPELSGRVAFRKTRLRSITSEILSESTETATWGHELAVLGDDVQMIIPRDYSEEKKLLTTQYLSLWGKLAEVWNQNRLDDPWKYINRALTVLEPVTWCVPSATNVRPDISLFDHLKTTSAIAGCLYRCKSNQNPFILLTGDYGGVQNYIFDLRPGVGQVAKCLRGRSFYVRVISEVISLKILQESGCPATHRIMHAGGRFYLLLPNDNTTKEAIEDALNKYERWILERKNGELRYALGLTEVSREELRGNFPEAKRRADEDLARQKQKPLNNILWQKDNNGDPWLLKKLEFGEDEELCESCLKQVGKTQPDFEGNIRYICPDCDRDRSDGKKLTRRPMLAFYNDSSEKEGRLPFFTYKIMDQESLKSLRAEDALALLDFQGHSDAQPKIPLMPFRLARYVPRDENLDVIEFDDIAKKAIGKSALGYLKADVDNLGYIFQHGFKKEANKEKPPEASISRLATLSRMLEIFFASYFEAILREKFQNVYLVYSGGDDVLVIGPWDQMIDLALDLADHFRRFTCEHPAWGISAGIAVVSTRTPVLKAVQMADTCLEHSKGFEGKNALTVFNTTFDWQRAREALETAKRVLGWLNDGTLNTSKVHRLLRYAEMHRLLEKKGETIYLRYVPQLIYDLKRNWKGGREDDTQNEKEALQWAASLTNPAGDSIRQLHFICQYALYGIRGKGGKDDNA